METISITICVHVLGYASANSLTLQCGYLVLMNACNDARFNAPAQCRPDNETNPAVPILLLPLPDRYPPLFVLSPF